MKLLSKLLYKLPQKLIGVDFLFVYWDKYAQVLEFNIFNHPIYFWIPKE